MASPAEVELLRNRDLALYGNPDGPTFEQLVASRHERGFSGDALYLEIIRGAQTTDVETDRELDD